MVHAPHTKFHVISTVLEDGHDGNLAKGQLAVVKNKAVKGLGKEVLSDFNGLTQKDLIAIEIGERTTPGKQRTVEVPYVSSGWFPIGSITDIKAYAPSNVTLKVDHLEIGYDGLNVATGLYIPEGKSAVMDIVVEGQVASMFFGQKSYIIQKRAYRAEDESMQSVIRRLVKELNEENVPTATGWASTTDQLSQFLEIGTIDSSAVALEGVDSIFSSLTVIDNGDSNDFADIQAQYPLYQVELTSRDGDRSTYTILHPAGTTLANYVKTVVDVDAKGCEDCLAGYDEVAGGFVYHVAIEDDGVDLTATVAGLITGETSVTKFGNKNGKGTYSVLMPTVLADAAIDAIVTARPEAEVSYRGEVGDVCSDTITTSTAWVDGETCTATTKPYTITLLDNECGETRLPELVAAYPDLTIIEGAYSGAATQGVTLAGASGDAVITVNDTNYTTAYVTSPTATATAFVTAHAAAILADTGAVVTSAGAVVIFTVPVGTPMPSIAGVAGGMTETVGAITYASALVAGGCKRTYSTRVNTNIVCDQCSDVFLQPFYGEAPTPFDGVAWEEAVEVFDADAAMGIYIKGKPFFLYPEAIEEDFIPYMETSLKVRSASFGYREDDILNYTGEQYDVDLEFAKVRKLQYAQDVDNLSESLFGAEDEGHLFGTNKVKHRANLFARANLSQERILKYHKRMLRYVVEFRDQSLSQGSASRSDITHGFGIIVEEGRHESLQELLGNLASKRGIPAPIVSLV